jgi:hypothetical protein
VTAEAHKPIKVEDIYGLTEREQLHDRISDLRLQQILDDEQTTVHSVELSTNNYGEFLFISTSRFDGQNRKAITFWGAGLHEYRERWITHEWFFYSWNPPSGSDRLAASLSKDEARKNIRQRKDELAHYGTPDVQSSRGKFFELLADLTDEDGAWAEVQDLRDLLDDDLLP